MSDGSAIEWTDASWNPVRGCRKVSPGCKHCYAEAFAERFRGVPGHPYERGFDPRLVDDQIGAPLTWRKPRRVFVNSVPVFCKQLGARPIGAGAPLQLRSRKGGDMTEWPADLAGRRAWPAVKTSP